MVLFTLSFSGLEEVFRMEKRIDNTKGWPFLSYALMAFACL